MFEEYLPLAGMLLIIIAWIPETLQNWRDKGRDLNPRFVALYLFGSLFLAYHAFRIKDLVFLSLNGLATLIALFNGLLVLSSRMAAKPAKRAKKKK